jgi:hypothetical protein
MSGALSALIASIGPTSNNRGPFVAHLSAARIEHTSSRAPFGTSRRRDWYRHCWSSYRLSDGCICHSESLPEAKAGNFRVTGRTGSSFLVGEKCPINRY